MRKRTQCYDVFSFYKTELMTVAPSHTTMKNLHPRQRPLSQPLSSLYREPPESNLLYEPYPMRFVFLLEECSPFFVFLSPLLGTESQKCVTECSTGTVA